MSTSQTFACHKIIRSKDAQWMQQHNILAQTHPIPLDQKEALLKNKLMEEAGEVTTAHTHDKSLSELVHVQETIWALLHQWEISQAGFEKMCQEKPTLRGSYADAVLLTGISLNDDNDQYPHFKSHPEKFIPVSEKV
jgi:predicted house-cleaning noncanonical NTP pyrophosphatase (MazG superfamily)